MIEALEARIAPAFAAILDIAALTAAKGFEIRGESSLDYAGYSVSAAGDVNGDGFDDLLIGAYGADPAGNESAGAAYVIFGKSTGFTAPMALSSLNGANGFRIDGAAEADYAGQSVSGAGDVNHDRPRQANVLLGRHVHQQPLALHRVRQGKPRHQRRQA